MTLSSEKLAKQESGTSTADTAASLSLRNHNSFVSRRTDSLAIKQSFDASQFSTQPKMKDFSISNVKKPVKSKSKQRLNTVTKLNKKESMA